MPEIVPIPLPLKEKFIPHVIAGTGPGGGIGAVLGLELRVQLFVQDGYFDSVLHVIRSFDWKIQVESARRM